MPSATSLVLPESPLSSCPGFVNSHLDWSSGASCLQPVPSMSRPAHWHPRQPFQSKPDRVACSLQLLGDSRESIQPYSSLWHSRPFPFLLLPPHFLSLSVPLRSVSTPRRPTLPPVGLDWNQGLGAARTPRSLPHALSASLHTCSSSQFPVLPVADRGPV